MTGDPVSTGEELLAMGAGFRAFWTDDAKRPYRALTRHGALDATDDPRVLHEWAYLVPDSDLAIVLPDGFAVIDCDHPDIPVDGIPDGTWCEVTRRGSHHLVTLPEPVPSRCRLPDGAGDFLSGRSSYIVMAPSRDRVPRDVAAPALRLDRGSPLWQHVVRAMQDRARRPATVHQRAQRAKVQDGPVRVLLERLQAGKYGATVTAIVEGRWHDRYRTRSEGDFALAFMATYYTDDANVIVALLHAVSPKARDERDGGEHYIDLTVLNALAARDRTNCDRLDRLWTILSVPEDSGKNVYGVTPSRSSVGDAIVRFAAIAKVDEFARGDGWRRLPVEDLAAVCGVHRQTVWRKLCALAAEGVIEYASIREKADKGWRTDSSIRLVSRNGADR